MALINMQDVTINLGGKPLLENASLAVEPGERVCITGRNGAGKSTLLAILGGQLEPDGGSVIRSVETLGQMPQDVPQSWQGSVFSLVAEVLGDEGRALAAAHTLAGKSTYGSPVGSSQGAPSGVPVSEPASNRPEPPELPSLPEPDAGWERYGEILGIIKHLELEPDDDFASLSGGTKRRVALARALVLSEDLILDEPTNHLDIATITWLEDFLQRKARTLIFVSHDRAFVRRLATRMVEVDRGKLYSYDCGYDQYAAKREERLEIEERHFALFDKKLAQEEAWIRQGVKARRTRNMGRVRELYKMRDERRARRERQGSVQMLTQEAERSGKLVIEAKGVSFAYPAYSGGPGANPPQAEPAPLFSGFSTVIQRGDRVGLVGANGSGKSTLLKVLLGELQPTHGSIRYGTNLQVSYFDQLREKLDPDVSVMNSVAEGNDMVQIGGNTRHVAGYLQDFLFTPDRLRIPVSALSGGERNRLLLAKLFTRPSNVLVLDEPTNDLDVETLELLEELVSDYSGTVILVSHDRQFLDNLVTSTLALEGDGKVHEYVGAYTDWLRQRAVPEATAAKKQEPRQTANPVNATNDGKPRKLSFNEQRELTLLAETLRQLPEQLAILEAEQAGLEKSLQDPEFFNRDPEGFNRATDRLSALDDEMTALLERWEEAEARQKELGE